VRGAVFYSPLHSIRSTWIQIPIPLGATANGGRGRIRRIVKANVFHGLGNVRISLYLLNPLRGGRWQNGGNRNGPPGAAGARTAKEAGRQAHSRK
jgi:hypothetical protein